MDMKKVEQDLREILGIPTGILEKNGDAQADGRWLFKIPFEDVERADETWYQEGGQKTFEKKHPDFKSMFLSVVAIPPKLVKAKPGDFVLVYSKWARSISELPVGIVTSVRKQGKKVCYGCSFIIGFHTWAPHQDQVFEFTQEDYGGYPIGFYRVLKQEEAVQLAALRIRAEVQKSVKNLIAQMAKLETELAREFKRFKHKTVVVQVSSEELRPQDYKG